MARIPKQWRFLMGDEVLTADGASLGLVLGFIPEDPADGTPDFVIVEKGILTVHDLYVPVAAVASYAGGRIVLAVTQDEVPGKGWERSLTWSASSWSRCATCQNVEFESCLAPS